MYYEVDEHSHILLRLKADEALTLRHCIIEALEALSESEFLVRTGGSKEEAESLLDVLMGLTADIEKSNK